MWGREDGLLTKQLSIEQETRPGRVMVASRGDRRAGSMQEASLYPAPFWRKWLGSTRITSERVLEHLPCQRQEQVRRQLQRLPTMEGRGGREEEGKTPPPSNGSKARLCHARDSLTARRENGVIGSACKADSRSARLIPFSSRAAVQHRATQGGILERLSRGPACAGMYKNNSRRLALHSGRRKTQIGFS